MDLQLRGKKAFISGSTQGIGFAIAHALVREGASVVVNGRDPAGLRRAMSRLEAVRGDERPEGHVQGHLADFADVDQVEALVEQLDDIDILVNNVGLFGLAPFETIDDPQWQRYLDVNVMSGVRLCRRLLPRMLSRGEGRIIFVSSESGVNVPADMVHYGVTKASMLALSNGLAKLTRGTEVTVNTILGGPTFSDGVAATVATIAQSQSVTPEDLKAAIIAGNHTSLLERFIDPSEIAHLALYLASPLSSATNGAALRADGGVLTALL